MAENSIITKKARENMVKARAGAITLPKIVGMAFGSGGVDTSGNVIVPTAEQAALKNELFRKEIDGYSFVMIRPAGISVRCQNQSLPELTSAK